MNNNEISKKQLTGMQTFAFSVALLFPLTIFAFACISLYDTINTEGSPDGQLLSVIQQLVFIVAPIIILFRVLVKYKQLTSGNPSVDEVDEPIALRHVGDSGPIWDMSRHPVFPWRGLLVTPAFFLVGFMVFVMPKEGWQAALNTLEARQWPTVMGMVVKSKVLEMKSDFAHSANYRADIEISYSVGDEEYKLYELYPGQSSSWHDNMSAYKKRGQYRENQRVAIHYDPSNPAAAVADTSFQLWTLVYGGIMAALCLFGLMGVYYTVVQLKRYSS